MEAQNLITMGGALVVAVTGLYLLSFRPLSFAGGAIGASLAGGGLYYFATLLWPGALGPVAYVGYALSVGAAAFYLTYPRPVRLRGWGLAAVVLFAAWFVAAGIYVATGAYDHPGPRTAWDMLLMPGAMGLGIVLTPIVIGRWIEAGRDHAPEGVRFALFALRASLLVSGGFMLMQLATAVGGLGDYPPWFYTPTALSRAAVSHVFYFLLPAAHIVAALLLWRWRLPAFLFLAGAVSYVPFLLTPGEAMTRIYFSTWGDLVEPALLLYAQARYRIFEGEPTRVRPTLVLTVVVALFAYIFGFGMGLAALPPSIASFGAPVVGLVAAGAMAFVILPRNLRRELQRVLGPPDHPERADPLAAGSIILGRYRVERLLATGGQARILEAKDRDTGETVVLKALPADVGAAEARILRALRHPNVIRFVDVVEVPGWTLVVLAHAPGGNLRALLARRGGRLPRDEAARVARDVLTGLAAAHARGIAHRDVKPENVLLGADGRAMLTDFGSAREAQPGATIRVGQLGTLAYLAPEQVRGEPGDARSDVYAAAVVLHEVLAGAPPIALPAEDEFLARRAILSTPPRVALPPESAALAPVIERALSKDPADRYADARGMHAAFERALEPPRAMEV